MLQKRCTESSCRKVFSVRTFGGMCPYCGKEYPQLGQAICRYGLMLDGTLLKLPLDEIDLRRMSLARVGREVRAALRSAGVGCGFNTIQISALILQGKHIVPLHFDREHKEIVVQRW